ncbi:MAG: diguanylate cyclase [Desulfobulbaceae bacterium]|nr:diguanylate cyclase [Desulfobulbaceae bacterium]
MVERDLDIVARYGGEEFVIILPDTASQGAAIVAERIGEAMLRLALPNATSDTSEFVTISLGGATATHHILTDGAQLVALADQALYQAKRKGRNRYKVMPAVI